MEKVTLCDDPDHWLNVSIRLTKCSVNSLDKNGNQKTSGHGYKTRQVIEIIILI